MPDSPCGVYIAAAFNVARHGLGFAPTHVARLFGYSGITSRARVIDLKLQLCQSPSMDTFDRARSLIELLEASIRAFGSRAAIKRWLNRAHPMLDGKTPKSVLLGGHYAELRTVVQLVRSLCPR